MSEESGKANRPRGLLKTASLVLSSVLLLPFLYLTTVALLQSAYVHNLPFPSRSFLKGYAIPSNGMAVLPGIGSVYSNYCRVCMKLSGGDHESLRTDGNR